MKILITGFNGQLGRALVKGKPKSISLLLPPRSELNLLNESSCRNYIRENKPDWIINTAAYTEVDHAEDERSKAYAINTLSVNYFLEELQSYNGKLIQISSDYVFNGQVNYPLKPQDKKSPVNYYGLTKSKAEDLVLKNNQKIIRTSWLYGPDRKNFFLTMLKMHCKNSDISKPIKVVADQFGCPTSTFSLSKACWEIIFLDTPNILHWSDLGSASWYDFAFQIGEISFNLGLIKSKSKVLPIKSNDFQSKALRPNYSLLNCDETQEFISYKAKDWKIELRKVVEYMLKNNYKIY